MARAKVVGEVVLKKVRLSFPKLWKKEAATEDATPKYGASFLLDPNTPEGKANIRACREAIKAVQEDKFKKVVKLKPGREGLMDGEECISDNTGEPYSGYEGMMVVAAKNGNKFPIVDRARRPLDEEDGVIYAGCYVNAVIRFYGVDDPKRGGKGVFASLEAIQFHSDGEAFGAGAIDVDEYFDEFEDDEESYDDDDDGLV